MASAPNGSIIEIQSNWTFIGDLRPTAAQLTIRNGLGFAPSIQGDTNSATFWPASSATPLDLRLEELRLLPSPLANNTFMMEVNLLSTSSIDSCFRCSDCFFEGKLHIQGGGNSISRAKIDRCTIEGSIVSGCIDQGRLEVNMLDSNMRGRIRLDAESGGRVDLTIWRCRIGSLQLLTDDPNPAVGSNWNVLAESTLNVKENEEITGPGVYFQSFGAPCSARLVNVTISRFRVGVNDESEGA